MGVGQGLDDGGLSFILGLHAEHFFPLNAKADKGDQPRSIPLRSSHTETQGRGPSLATFTCQSGQGRSQGWWRSDPGAGRTAWLRSPCPWPVACFMPQLLSKRAADFLLGFRGPKCTPRAPCFEAGEERGRVATVTLNAMPLVHLLQHGKGGMRTELVCSESRDLNPVLGSQMLLYCKLE